MEPHMAPKDLQMFYKYLNAAQHYFEYGAGGSTFQASIRPSIQTIYSVESDLNWHNRIKTLIGDKPHIRHIYCEMKATGSNWGNPGNGSTLEDWNKYSGAIIGNTIFDFILIDGRFRVACCLKCFETIGTDTLIAFDDFLDRPQYHVVLLFYEIVEQTSDKRMVILKKRVGVLAPSKELIEKYEKIFD